MTPILGIFSHKGGSRTLVWYMYLKPKDPTKNQHLSKCQPRKFRKITEFQSTIFFNKNVTVSK